MNYKRERENTVPRVSDISQEKKTRENSKVLFSFESSRQGGSM